MRRRCLSFCALARLAGVLVLLLAIAIGCKVRRFDALIESSGGDSTSEDSPLTYGKYFEACKEALGTPPQITCHFPKGNNFVDKNANPQYQIPVVFDRDGKLQEERTNPWDREAYPTSCANFRENEGESTPTSCARYNVYALYQGEKKGSHWGVVCGQDDDHEMQNERYFHIQVIGYNSETGQTCFWASKRFRELKAGFAISAKKIASINPEGESGVLLPPRIQEDQESKGPPAGARESAPKLNAKILAPTDFWQSPEELLKTETGCVMCHQRGPWVSSSNLRWAQHAMLRRERDLENIRNYPSFYKEALPETYEGKLGKFKYSEVGRLFPKNPDKYSVVLHEELLGVAQKLLTERTVHWSRVSQWQRYAYRLPTDLNKAKAALKQAKFHPALAECSKCHSLVMWEQDIIKQAIVQHFGGYHETGLTEQNAAEIWEFFKSPNSRAFSEIRGFPYSCQNIEGCTGVAP